MMLKKNVTLIVIFVLKIMPVVTLEVHGASRSGIYAALQAQIDSSLERAPPLISAEDLHHVLSPYDLCLLHQSKHLFMEPASDENMEDTIKVRLCSAG
jgi:hypothetical protein